MVDDVIAEKLEQQKLWRRAAARWLVVMQSYELTCKQREWVKQQRLKCLNNVAIPQPEGVNMDIARISKAASATQKEMGIDRPNGGAFRRR